MVTSEYNNLTCNEVGTQLFHRVRAQQTELKDEDSLKANVDVWQLKDERIQSLQMVQAKRDRKSIFTAILNLENKAFMQLENDDMPSVNFSKKSAWAVGVVDTL